MNITFDERPGQIFDFYKSLWIINNYDYVMKIKEEYGTGEPNEFEKAIMDNSMDPRIDKKEIEKYFYREMRPEYFLAMEDIWKCKAIDGYLSFIMELNEYEHIIRADRTIQLICKNTYEDNESDEVKNIEVIKERILNQILHSDIPTGLKWEFFMITRSAKEYIEEAIGKVKKYQGLYNKISEAREKVIKSYNEEFKKNIESEGIEYLLKEIDNTYKFDENKEIRITTSALASLRIYLEDDVYYVLIGPNIKKALLNRNNKDEVEKNLNFIRGISENTRFKILQLLLERDYYGQEIADTLKLTKATTFYHLDFLISLKVVSLIKDSQKNFYSINKDKIAEGIEFFKKIWM